MTLIRQRAAVAVAAIASLTVVVSAQKVSVADVLDKAAGYLVTYAKAIEGIGVEETLTQRDVSVGVAGEFRRLRSDVVLLGFPTDNVMSFRDSFEMDGKPLREHQDRLLKLFADASANAVNSAQDYSVQTAARFLNMLQPMPNFPTLALQFLRRQYQERSDFKLDGTKTMDGAQVAVLKFTPRKAAAGAAEDAVINVPYKADVIGRFWIEVATGVVRQTEMSLDSPALHGKIGVVYKLDPQLKIWLPVQLDEQYEVYESSGDQTTNVGEGASSTRRSFEGHAQYRNYQQAAVDFTKIR